jgi:Fe-S-cluster-containing dehydrogenase component
MSRVLRAVLIAATLVIALVSGGALDKNRCVTAKSCDEAFVDYYNANSAYDIARVSYFYGQPVTCADECQRSQDPNCVQNCQTDRRTELGQAEITLFSLASATS